MLDRASRTRLLIVTLCTLALAVSSPLHAGSDRWTSAGPPLPAAVLGLSFDPLTPGTLYLATETGDLYVSSDGGDHWQLLENAPTGFEPPLVSPTVPGLLYLNRGNGSVWKSSNRGTSWQPLPDVAQRLWAIDPATGALYASNGGVHLIRSLDGGATFTPVPYDIPIFGSDLFAVVVDRAHPGTIYVSTSDALYRSTDDGAHWTAGGSLGDFGPADLTVAPAGGSVLYGRAYYSPGTPPCLVRSMDAGATFQEVAPPIATPSTEGCFWAVDPAADRTIHVLVASASDPTHRRAFTSQDAGNTWQEVGEGAQQAEFLAIDPFHPATWYAGGTGISRSTDSGHTFISLDVPGGSFNLLVTAPGPRSAVYAAVPYVGLFSTRSAGRSWRQLIAYHVTALAVDPADPLHLVAGLSGAFAASTDGGVSFAPSSAASQPEAITRLAFDPSNSRVLYAGTEVGEIWKSADSGAHWQRFGKGIPVLPPCDQTFCPIQTVSALVVDPAHPLTVYAVAGGRVYKSVNGGRRFSASGSGLETVGVGPLVQDPAHPATLWTGGCGGVFKSLDGGASWALRSYGLPFSEERSPCVSDLVVDPAAPGTLHVSFFDDGVFRSLDGAETWAPENAGLGHQRIEALALELPSGRLWAATIGSGLYVGEFTTP